MPEIIHWCVLTEMGKKENLPAVRVRVLDSIWIHELFHNYTDGTISLSRCHAEDSGVIIWTIDGRDLLDQRWLSPDNRTLIIPYNHTGVITVSNPVSADNKSITVIKDLNGEPGHLGHVMGLNVIRLIWGDGGDEPTIGALLLPRNISTIYILLTPSEETHEPHWRSWKRVACVVVPLVLILMFFGFYVIYQRKKANSQVL
ncbi:uncharacterized protein [Ranitomeya imitator]|uniref:uncharacterized protein n=1 Tax=Ranitomeya imitator TaxID=111125 RepID=UPI0037E9B564